MDADVVVIGAGAVGTSTALHLAHLGHKVLVIEKETGPAHHQSGRNSGVIHAGYNVKPGTEKARFCVEGNRRLRAYCEEKQIAMLPGGILVVARTEAERPVLAELLRRGQANGTAVKIVNATGLHELEPHAQGIEGLHAADAASFDPNAYVASLVRDAEAAGVEFRFGVRVKRPIADDAGDGPLRGHGGGAAQASGHDASGTGFDSGAGVDRPGVTVETTKGRFRARVAVNAAGLWADRIAGALCPDLRVIPFRGTYAEVTGPNANLVRSHIYAAPDLSFPFLGIHLSRRADGRVLAGPGAMMAMGREAYGTWSVRPDVAGTLAWPGFYRMLGRPEVRRLVAREVRKSFSLRAVWDEARRLVPELRPEDLRHATSGIRAQMLRRDGSFEEDIVVRETRRCVHVLNAVSPGLTCSLPFGESLAKRAAALL